MEQRLTGSSDSDSGGPASQPHILQLPPPVALRQRQRGPAAGRARRRRRKRRDQPAVRLGDGAPASGAQVLPERVVLQRRVQAAAGEQQVCDVRHAQQLQARREGQTGGEVLGCQSARATSAAGKGGGAATVALQPAPQPAAGRQQSCPACVQGGSQPGARLRVQPFALTDSTLPRASAGSSSSAKGASSMSADSSATCRALSSSERVMAGASGRAAQALGPCCR